jgi:hypothetical protein
MRVDDQVRTCAARPALAASVGDEWSKTCHLCECVGVGVASAVPGEADHDQPPRLDEFEHIGHWTARLLRPVGWKLCPYGHQHDRHFVLGKCELAGERFRVESDHRGRT